MATSVPASPASPASSAASPAPAAPASVPGAAGASASPAPRTEADFLAGAPGPADALFQGEEAPAEGEQPAEGQPAESPDAIFEQIEQGLPEELRAAFKQRLDSLRTDAGRVKALAEQRKQVASVADHNFRAGQGAMQIAGLAIQRLRAANLDASDLEGYLGGNVPDGQGAPGQQTDDGGASGDFDYLATAREAIQTGLDDTYWGHYDTAVDEAESAIQAARDLVDANHPQGADQLKRAIANRRNIDRIHSRRLAAVSSHPTKAVFDALSRRIAELEGGRNQEAEGQQFVSVVKEALREHVHATDDLGKHIWREGGKFPLFTADGKQLAQLGRQMINAMGEFWEETGTDPSDPKAFARAFHAVRGEMGVEVPAQAAPQGAADGSRGGGDPTLPGGASIPVAAVGRSPFQTPESARQAVLERNRRAMRAS